MFVACGDNIGHHGVSCHTKEGVIHTCSSDLDVHFHLVLGTEGRRNKDSGRKMLCDIKECNMFSCNMRWVVENPVTSEWNARASSDVMIFGDHRVWHSRVPWVLVGVVVRLVPGLSHSTAGNQVCTIVHSCIALQAVRCDVAGEGLHDAIHLMLVLIKLDGPSLLLVTVMNPLREVLAGPSGATIPLRSA